MSSLISEAIKKHHKSLKDSNETYLFIIQEQNKFYIESKKLELTEKDRTRCYNV